MITGILAVDKPLGWTSHDVVARVRRIAGQREVGHAGTLDPLAGGVLLLVLGSATRLSSYLMDSEKEYYADVVLGATTATDDGEAPLQERRDVGQVDRASVECVVTRYVGTFPQVPPRYAAVRRGGEKLYVIARRGEKVEIEARDVTIHAISVLDWDSPKLRIRVRCGAGTYIRSLARDIGETLGVGGYLHALRRTVSGTFTADECVRLDDLADRSALVQRLVSADRAVIDWPALLLAPEEERAIRAGKSVVTADAGRRSIRLYGSSGDLVALGEGAGDLVKPIRVFLGEPDGAGH